MGVAHAVATNQINLLPDRFSRMSDLEIGGQLARF